MNWTDDVIDQLQQNPIGGYHSGQIAATEPTALAALALLAHGRHAAALRAAEWLVTCQTANGSVGVRFGEPEPRWPTSLTTLVWTALGAHDEKLRERFNINLLSAVHWMLSCRGVALKQDPEMGHDTTLVAWPWVEGTHSWLEPTAFFVLALKAAGESKHVRTREAVRCLIDRQLSTGGCNYGNTSVLGQELRPHVQPTGIAMLALTGENDASKKIATSLNYLAQTLNRETTTASLCFGLQGLAAHGRLPAESHEWLTAAHERTTKNPASTFKLALLSLAASGDRSPLIQLVRQKSAEGIGTP